MNQNNQDSLTLSELLRQLDARDARNARNGPNAVLAGLGIRTSADIFEAAQKEHEEARLDRQFVREWNRRQGSVPSRVASDEVVGTAKGDVAQEVRVVESIGRPLQGKGTHVGKIDQKQSKRARAVDTTDQERPKRARTVVRLWRSEHARNVDRQESQERNEHAENVIHQEPQERSKHARTVVRRERSEHARNMVCQGSQERSEHARTVGRRERSGHARNVGRQESQERSEHARTAGRRERSGHIRNVDRQESQERSEHARNVDRQESQERSEHARTVDRRERSDDEQMEDLASVLRYLEEEFAEKERLSHGQEWCVPIPLAVTIVT